VSTLRAALTRIEYCLTETRQNLALFERRLCDRPEAETISRRPKSRWYHRRMSRWTGADEAEYRHILDLMTDVAQPELDRLRRKAERQNDTIEVRPCKYRVNEDRPRPFVS
jgi:hypothetical protein